MKETQCSTQSELDAAIKAGEKPILIGSGYFVARGSSHVEAWESSHVEARESSHVVAWGSSRVVAWGSSHVEARGSSHVEAWESSHVEAWESSHVVARESSHVVAWGSSHVVAWGSSHVVAWGSSHVEASGSSHVVASKFVPVQIHSTACKVVGGVKIKIVQPKTVVQWASFYGVKITKGMMILYKGVDKDFRATQNQFLYTPGTKPAAPDWDGGKAECGGGLHFSPHPAMTLEFNRAATKFVACPVRVKDCRATSTNDSYPQKIKAKGLCAPCWEVDRKGNKV